MKNPSRNPNDFTRRRFIKTSTAVAGAMLLPPLAWAETNAVAPAATVRRTAVDQVMLGQTGIKLSRLGFGTGSGNGAVQTADGKNAFIDLIHYAYDQGITYLDTSGHLSNFSLDCRRDQRVAARKTFHPVQSGRTTGGRAGGD